MFLMMASGLSGGPSGVKAFGEDRLVYWRESAAGHSRFAYFIGVATAQFYRIALNALHFTMLFHVLAAPTIGFGSMYGVLVCVFYAIYGLAIIISMILPIEDASLAAVIATLFAAVFGGYLQSLPTGLKKISYAYW
jgi:ABC-type multidrug transport system permease subunit